MLSVQKTSSIKPPTPFKIKKSSTKTSDMKASKTLKNNKENVSNQRPSTGTTMRKKKPVAGMPAKSSFKKNKSSVLKARPMTAQPKSTALTQNKTVHKLGGSMSSHKLNNRRSQKTQKTKKNTNFKTKTKNDIAKTTASTILRDLNRLAALPRNASMDRADSVVRCLVNLLRMPRTGLKEKTLQGIDSIREQLASTPLFSTGPKVAAAPAPVAVAVAAPAVVEKTAPVEATPVPQTPEASGLKKPRSSARKSTGRRKSRRQSKQPAAEEEVAPAPVEEVVEVVEVVVEEVEEVAKEVVEEMVKEEVEEVVEEAQEEPAAEVKEVVEVAEEAEEETPAPAPAAEVNQFEGMTYRDLQKACKSRGLKAGGSAVDLRKRLTASE